MPRAKIKASRYTKQMLNHEDFKFFYNALYAVFGSQRRVAQALNVAYTTYLKWEKQPPQWPYWPIVMEFVLRQRMTALKASRSRSFNSTKYWTIMQEIGQHTKNYHIAEEIHADAVQLKGASDYLRRLLSTGGKYWHEINQNTRTRGTYSARALQKAAHLIGVIKTKEGFGGDKRSFWRLPSAVTDEDRPDFRVIDKDGVTIESHRQGDLTPRIIATAIKAGGWAMTYTTDDPKTRYIKRLVRPDLEHIPHTKRRKKEKLVFKPMSDQ